MSVILISNVAGKVPTVSQLLTADSGLGYNRVDALFYGIKITELGVKSVVCLGESLIPGVGESHERLHSITSKLDHAAATETNYNKLIATNALTGAIEYIDKEYDNYQSFNVLIGLDVHQIHNTLSGEGIKFIAGGNVAINGSLSPEGVLGLTFSAETNPGTVTSVGLAMPSQFSVSNSPVTGSGTLTASWEAQAAGTVLAAPTSAAGVPSFRFLTPDDIPELAYDNYASWDLEYFNGENGYVTTAITSGRNVKFVNANISVAANTVTVTIPDFQLMSKSVKTLAHFHTDTANSGSVVTDAFTYTMPPNTLSADGQRIELLYCGLLLNGSANDKTATVKFGADQLYQFVKQGTSGGDSNWKIKITLMRVSSSSYKFIAEGYAENQYLVHASGTATGVNFTASNTIKLTLQGAASNYINAKLGAITWFPET